MRQIENRLAALEQRQKASAGGFVFAAQFDGGPCYRYEVSEGAPHSEAEAIERGLEIVDPAEYDNSATTLIVIQYVDDWRQN